MGLITRPHRFIKDELGYDATLIYGDVKDGDGGNVILYSSHPLRGYHADGGTYFKVLSADEDIVKKGHFRLSYRRAQPFPYEYKFTKQRIDESGSEVSETCTKILKEPDKYDAELFGVSGSFAYANSRHARRFFLPKNPRYHAIGSIMIDDDFIPDDAVMVHEGAHLVSYPLLKDVLIPAFGGLVKEKANDCREDIISEAFSMVSELMYIEKFHPKAEGRYHDFRRSEGSHYADAYVMATKNRKEVEDMIKVAKTTNANKGSG
jgi:hypothetical protein